MNEIKGLVIGSVDYKEKSKIVYLYTPNGHESVKVTGAKDNKKGALGFTMTLNVVSYIRSNSDFPTLLEYSLIKSNYDKVSSLDNINSISLIVKIIKNIPSDADHGRIFNFILSIIDNLSKENNKKLMSLFLIKMLYAFGVTPNLKSCVRCGNPNLVFLNIEYGGGLCSNCCNHKDVSKLNLWKEYYYSKLEIKDYSDCDFDLFLKDIINYYNIHCNLNLKNIDII